MIEGFYGQPWTASERMELFDWMAAWGLNTYVYAPKDDLHHRALWREPYAAADAERLRQLIDACCARDIRFVYGLSPGLDIHYGRETELNHLRQRLEQMMALGCGDFSLLFDDIPDDMDAADRERWGSFASAQCHVANALFTWLRERSPAGRFLFCPTAYCGRMAAAKLGGEDYLATVGRELLPGIDVFWTGPDIVSREITVAHVREIAALLRRKPLIWDNLHANDYDGRRFFCGPYSGRPPELRGEVSGLLSNPNSEFPLNYVPLRTLAAVRQGVRFMGSARGLPRGDGGVGALVHDRPRAGLARRLRAVRRLLLPAARRRTGGGGPLSGREPACWMTRRSRTRPRSSGRARRGCARSARP